MSVTELISGNAINNVNVSANVMRSKFYVCPVCGNVIHCMGETVINVKKGIDDKKISYDDTVERKKLEHPSLR